MVVTHDAEPVWDKPVDVPEKWIQQVDQNVASSKLPCLSFCLYLTGRIASWLVDQRHHSSWH